MHPSINKKEFIETLKERFIANLHRHPNLDFSSIQTKLDQNKELLDAIYQMEITGGEVDVWVYENKNYFVDFSKESPEGRRSLCYDEKALDERKENKPIGSVVALCKKWGVSLLDEIEYKALQVLEPLDLKTSSWLLTPDALRSLGGALFGDNRYKRCFIYHNGANSYYSARGFRVKIEI